MRPPVTTFQNEDNGLGREGQENVSESSAECVRFGLGFALRGELLEIYGVVYLAE